LNAQESEIAEVVRTQSTLPIRENSLTVKEIINILHHKGPKSVARLARELSINHSAVSIYIRYMRQMAIVSLHPNLRKSDRYVRLEIVPDKETRMPSY
jgi:predicted transcriptional regulator